MTPILVKISAEESEEMFHLSRDFTQLQRQIELKKLRYFIRAKIDGEPDEYRFTVDTNNCIVGFEHTKTSE